MGVELGNPPKVTYTGNIRQGANNITSLSTRKYGILDKITQSDSKFALFSKQPTSTDKKPRR